MEEAGVISEVGLTALPGLEDVLRLEKDESIIIFGASGGIGHLAVQLAKNMGARVFAIASGEDGVSMIRNLGIEAVDGHRDDVLFAAKNFAPSGFDAALYTAGGDIASSLVQCLRSSDRIAYTNGIYPIPEISGDVTLTGYNGETDPDILQRLTYWISPSSVQAHVNEIFLLEDAHKAHLPLNKHYVGKLCFKVN